MGIDSRPLDRFWMSGTMHLFGASAFEAEVSFPIFALPFTNLNPLKGLPNNHVKSRESPESAGYPKKLEPKDVPPRVFWRLQQ